MIILSILANFLLEKLDLSYIVSFAISNFICSFNCLSSEFKLARYVFVKVWVVFLHFFHKIIIEFLIFLLNSYLVLIWLLGGFFWLLLRSIWGLKLFQMYKPMESVADIQILKDFAFVQKKIFKLRFLIELVPICLNKLEHNWLNGININC